MRSHRPLSQPAGLLDRESEIVGLDDEASANSDTAKVILLWADVVRGVSASFALSGQARPVHEYILHHAFPFCTSFGVLLDWSWPPQAVRKVLCSSHQQPNVELLRLASSGPRPRSGSAPGRQFRR